MHQPRALLAGFADNIYYIKTAEEFTPLLFSFLIISLNFSSKTFASSPCSPDIRSFPVLQYHGSGNFAFFVKRRFWLIHSLSSTPSRFKAFDIKYAYGTGTALGHTV